MSKCRYKLFLMLTILTLTGSSLFAEEEKQEEKKPVIVNGDTVEYFQDEQKIVGSGNVMVRYEDMKLLCDKATVFLDTKDAFAEGNVALHQDNNIYYGDKGVYNFDSKRGEVTKGRIDAHPWYGKGEALKKVSAREVDVEEAYVTSCDYDSPHYRIRSKEVKIFLEDKIVAKNCVMFVGRYPFLYLPQYVHPLNENRPRVTIVPGYGKQWGLFTLTKWRYYLNENLRGYLHLDYREKKDLAWGVDAKYDTKYLGEGLLETYYMQERQIKSKRMWDWDKHDTDETERYGVQLRHKWQPDDYTNVIAEYHKFHDDTFLKDYFFRDYEQDEALPTYISALRQTPLYYAEFRIDKRANHYETVVERLPEFDLDFIENRIFDTNFYYTSENSISNLEKKFAVDAEEDIDVFRFDTYDQVSYLTKLFGFLSLSPYLGTRQTYFSKDKWGEPDWVRGIFYSGFDVSTRFYRLFRYDTNFLGLDINGLRHVINPVARYSYNHHPTVLPLNLMQFDIIDTLDRENKIKLELENKLQTKRRYGSKLYTVDLARFVVTTEYMYKVEQGSEFTDTDSSLEVKPYNWLYLQGGAKYDHLKSKIERADWDIVAHDPNPNGKWEIGLGQRYEIENTSQVTGELSYQITPKWKVKIYERYQFKENDLKEQEYSITRDLHCWTAELVYNVYRPQGEAIWVIFRLKEFPEAPIRATTSYHQPKTTSQTFIPLY